MFSILLKSKRALKQSEEVDRKVKKLIAQLDEESDWFLRNGKKKKEVEKR